MCISLHPEKMELRRTVFQKLITKIKSMKTKKEGTPTGNSEGSIPLKNEKEVAKMPHPEIKFAGGIVMMDPKKLSLHPLVENRYAHRPDKEEAAFNESVRRGLMQALLIIYLLGRYWVIVGTRRFKTALLTNLPLIPVQVVEVAEEDIPMVNVISNNIRVRTEVEIYQDAKVWLEFCERKQGKKDLVAPEGKSTHRDEYVAGELHISPSHLYRNQKVGDHDIELLRLVDYTKDEKPQDKVTLSEVYAGILPDKPKHEKMGEEISLTEINPCPYCGCTPKRIQRAADGTLTFNTEKP
jgi:hypothetical protein